MMRSRLAVLLAALTSTPALSAQGPITSLDSARHVLDRLAYGPTPGMVDRVAREGVMRWVDAQLGVDAVDDPNLRATLSHFDILSTPTSELVRRFLDAQRERRQRQAAGDTMMGPRPGQPPPGDAELRRLGGQLPQLVLVRAVQSDRQLAEVLADFWFNHFNIFIGKNLDRVLLPEYVEQVIRRHALGRFEDLLIATARSPAMMVYLDNTQSVKPGASPPLPNRGPFAIGRLGSRALDSMRLEAQQRRPTGLNENYARELLELHTLGVNGGYTQKDVTEVARILTGWSVALRGPVAARLARRTVEEGSFIFNAWAHDDGAKTVLGTPFPAGQGEEEGIRLLRMLAAHPSTMHFVSTKLCAKFVNDTPPDGCIDDAVRTWRRSDGNIREVLRAIIRSQDFWAGVNRGVKVKTPLEFVASAVRAIGARPDSSLRLALAVAQLGQPLYQHVAPNGYGEQEEDWVNSGALLNRMNLALALASGRAPGVRGTLDAVIPLSSDHPTLVESVNRIVLAGRMSEHTRKVILTEIGDLQDPVLARAMAVGLAIGAPEFQRQ